MTILVLDRLICASSYTQGELLWHAAARIEDVQPLELLQWLAVVLEDQDRGLDAGDPSTWPRKVYGDTCIPITAPRHPFFVDWSFSRHFGRDMPFISGIPTHVACMFHGGRNVAATLGCPLLCETVERGVVPQGASQPAVERFEAWFRKARFENGGPIPLYVRRRCSAIGKDGTR